MLVRVVGLGPGDPGLLTLGSLDALRASRRAAIMLAPAELTNYLQSQDIELVDDLISDPALFIRGSAEVIESFVQELTLRQPFDSAQDDIAGRSIPHDDNATHDTSIAIGVLGNPLSDFPGLPQLLRALEARNIHTDIVPGMPRETLSAAIAMPLVPLPPLSTHHTWNDLIEIMARLRRSCPWDREQTHRTLVPYLIEETYEVVEAIENADEAALCEELGDLLLQIVFHAQIGSETGRFTSADVIDALSNKMVRRHPHVFGEAVMEDVDAQWRNWERLKAEEATGRKRRSRLEGIPKQLGALQRGQRMQEKAARVGFDWPAVEQILDKLVEELGELADAQRAKHDDPHMREELGDVFFTLVNLSRALGVDAEAAMREANDKFYKRFGFMEARAAKEGKFLANMSLDELEELWKLAKTSRA